MINGNYSHKNSPKYFDEAVFEKIKTEYLAEDLQHEKEKQTTINDRLLITSLREQLALEREHKKNLIEQVNDLFKLLDQQQQLALLSTKKVDELEYNQEHRSKSEDLSKENVKQPEPKKRWWQFFR